MLSYFPLCHSIAVLCKYIVKKNWDSITGKFQRKRARHRTGEAWKLCVQMINTYLILLCIVGGPIFNYCNNLDCCTGTHSLYFYVCVLLETVRGLLAQPVCTTHNKHK